MNLLLLEEDDFIDDHRKRVRLTGRRLEHLQSVCRVSTGESIRMGLLNGPTGTGTVTSILPELIELEVTLPDAPPPPLPCTLILALPRPKSLKKSIETATSLGIKKIYLIGSWRVEKSYWSSPVLEEDSLNKHMHLGLEQARDTMLPTVEIRKLFKPFVEDELPGIISTTLPLLAHPYNAQPCPVHAEKPVTLMIGPEGGFIPYEVDKLVELGFKPVTIGDRILRVETAIAAFTGRLW